MSKHKRFAKWISRENSTYSKTNVLVPYMMVQVVNGCNVIAGNTRDSRGPRGDLGAPECIHEMVKETQE